MCMSDGDPESSPRVSPVVTLLPIEFEGRHVGHLSVDTPGERDEWEMHPEQDELLYLIEGAVDVHLRGDLEVDDERTIHLLQGDACIVPKEMWHRQVVIAPCEMLFLTPKTLHRPYAPARNVG